MKSYDWQKIRLMMVNGAFNVIATVFFGVVAWLFTTAPNIFFQAPSSRMDAFDRSQTFNLVLTQLAVGALILLCAVGAAGFRNWTFFQRMLANRRAALGWTVALTLLPAGAVMSATAFSIRTCSFG